jgi:hypothetical protein
VQQTGRAGADMGQRVVAVVNAEEFFEHAAENSATVGHWRGQCAAIDPV